MTYNHSAQVKTYMDKITEQAPDIFLISSDGDQVGTHKIVLRLFSPFLSDIITQPEQVSHISIPASGSVLNHLVNTLATGVAITIDREELNKVEKVANILGLDFIDWQVGMQRKKRRLENLKLESESLGDAFNEASKEMKRKLDGEVEVNDLPVEVKMECFENKSESEVSSGNQIKHTLQNAENTIVKEAENSDKQFSCDLCPKVFSSKKNHWRHMKNSHGKASKKASVANGSNKDNFPCNLCE